VTVEHAEQKQTESDSNPPDRRPDSGHRDAPAPPYPNCVTPMVLVGGVMREEVPLCFSQSSSEFRACRIAHETVFGGTGLVSFGEHETVSRRANLLLSVFGVELAVNGLFCVLIVQCCRLARTDIAARVLTGACSCASLAVGVHSAGFGGQHHAEECELLTVFAPDTLGDCL
jgi:hypothetical protein